MKAHPNFLAHVLPYLELDPQTALVQTPQHFFNVDHTGDVFNHQNSTFFFGCQTGLDSWRATVCGSAAGRTKGRSAARGLRTGGAARASLARLSRLGARACPDSGAQPSAAREAPACMLVQGRSPS